MPIFEYKCGKCEHEFETLVQGQQKPECPSCGSRKLEKLISAFAVNASPRPFANGIPPAACGTCGHPGGPGACRMN